MKPNPEKEMRALRAILQDALSNSDEASIVENACKRLVEAGLPLSRFNVSQPILHPTIGGDVYIWRRDVPGVETDTWLRAAADAGVNFAGTPFHRLLSREVDTVRYALDLPTTELGFPLLVELQDQGATDYYAFRTELGAGLNLGQSRFILTSWVTDQRGGFQEGHIELIRSVSEVFALVLKTSSNQKIGQNVVETYLGRNASDAILSGMINRGAGHSIRAALWSSDLQGFTKISDEVPRDQLLEMTNEYFGCVVESVHKYGGSVLKFLGDGVLAIFNHKTDSQSTCAALHAAEHLRREITKLTLSRRRQDLPATGLYLGLHLGEVHYGNVGSEDRLDFTVTGPAVNEVFRIEGMCRSLERDVVISEKFASAVGLESVKLSPLGKHILKGVRTPQELYSLDSFGSLLC